MKITAKILKKIKLFEEGKTFRYYDLKLEDAEYSAASKAVERLVKKGILKRVVSGVFYKPKMSVFGYLEPSENEILKNYLYEKNEMVAYLTGPGLYNSMALTTQIPTLYYAASRKKRISVKLGRTVIRPASSYVEVSKSNYIFLQYLDALKDFSKIYDLDTEFALGVLITNLKKFDDADRKKLIKYALEYPPRVRAFLGTLLERAGFISITAPLKKSLNPLSYYKYRISTILPEAKKWNII